MIDFDALAARAQPHHLSLLQTMLPEGRLKGKEFECGDIHGSHGDSFRFNIETGCWADFATGQTGGDMCSLIAEIKNEDMRSAAERLSAFLGIDLPESGNNGAPPAAKPKKTKAPVFKPILPVPLDAPPAPEKNQSARWTYRDADGRVLHHVNRWDNSDGSKTIAPLCYGTYADETGWHQRHIPKNRPLYNLDILAKRSQDPVLIVEGEKAADAAATLAPGYAVTTWSGGSKAFHIADLKPLRGRTVTLWPDNDDPGKQAMEAVFVLLQQLECTCWIVALPDNLPPKWDAADALEDGWTVDKVKQLLTPPPIAASDTPYTPAGFNHGVYFYFVHATRQIHALTASEHKKQNFLSLAPLEHWESSYVGKKGTDWDVAMDALLRQCEAKGLFDISRIRGRGAWYDEGRIVIHIGDRLIVDGTEYDLHEINTRFVYEASHAWPPPHKIPLGNTEAAQVLDISKLFRWDNDLCAYLLAGWIVIARVCGALRWRPHIWLTGSSGSGKTWIMDNFVTPLLGAGALQVQSATTEAGLRQALGMDARPVVFDEAEGEKKLGRARISAVLELMRQASSETGGKILKGSGTGVSKAFIVRSCFCMASIDIGMEQLSDQTRISVLSLQTPHPNDIEERNNFKSIKDALTQIPPDFSERLFARTIRLIPTIRANVETFATAAAEQLGTQRIGDQVGTLLAGAFSLVSEQLITPEKATEWIAGMRWDEQIEEISELDEDRCINHLMQATIRVEGKSKPVERNIGELLQVLVAGFADDHIDTETAENTLRRIGIRVHNKNVIVANSSTKLKTIFEGTTWSASYHRTLKRLPGATPSNTMRFTAAFTGKGTALPIALFDWMENTGQTTIATI